MARCVRDRKYPAKSLLLSAGQRWNRLFYIRKGLVRLYYLDAQGKESNKPVLFSIAALENVDVIECEMAALKSIFIEPGLGSALHCRSRKD